MGKAKRAHLPQRLEMGTLGFAHPTRVFCFLEISLLFMVLYLSSVHCQSMQHHAERTYPDECCGLILGRQDRQSRVPTWLVIEIWQTTNTWDSSITENTEDDENRGTEGEQDSLFSNTNSSNTNSKANRYWIDPKEMLEVQRYGRDRQLDIIGIYHSHPDHAAVPSECDRTLAWSGYSYLIVSVQQGIAQDLLCWRLDDNHQFQPEAMQVVAVMSL